MPPSSAFSHRRQILRRPKICLPPPPPPPPPPTAWPPDSFVLQWIANWNWEETPFGFNVFLDFLPVAPGQMWEAYFEQDENVWVGSFELDYEAHTANLTLGYQGEGDEAGCQRYALPIVWGLSTLYAVTDWDTTTPWGSLHEAHFTF